MLQAAMLEVAQYVYIARPALTVMQGESYLHHVEMSLDDLARKATSKQASQS